MSIDVRNLEDWNCNFTEPMVKYKDHLATIAELTRERDELREAQRWISVADRMPEDDFLGAQLVGGQFKLIEVMSGPKLGYIPEDGKFTFFALWGRRPCRVTHWHPLPKENP